MNNFEVAQAKKEKQIKEAMQRKEEGIAKHELAKQVQIRKTSCFNGAVDVVSALLATGAIKELEAEEKIRDWTAKLEEMYLEYTGQVPF